ncbi:type II toxin-antitoxin system RelE/ParE family toxin [Mesorhizobium sp. VK24D]|uniref:Type II toxin-antitoxin system RelE/ParE family toxin n=1 Tax=Mesorhizobium album TaxID=3072314 RepID=A0ABU4XXM3_9HYPH|nr:type II toxin-antitoxin system RelE/ParE family toxin [Mesorhizobium sp. VK24D]MDX8479457.1 type II toxin-antitoxin system RelE/ParE family toxin [Mesorhizobium sp. VK24D]
MTPMRIVCPIASKGAGGNWPPAYPLSGPPRDDIASGIRHLIVGEYLTLYRVSGDAIEILRVLHGRRQIGADDLAP